MSVEFNIVEGDSTKEYFDTYESIVEDLKNGLSVKEIREKNGLLSGNWKKFQKKLVEDGFLRNMSMVQETSKYYYPRSNGFVVSKYIGTGNRYLAKFKTEEEAKMCVELFKECNWDLDKTEEIIKKVQEAFE